MTKPSARLSSKLTMSKAAAETASGSQRLLQALSALQHRNYRLYWLGQLSSVLAQNMEGVAQSWLVLELTDSPLLLGLTGLTFAAPTIALTLLGGVIADRADRRRIMILSQGAAAAMFFLLATLIIIERVALWQVNRLIGPAVAGMLIYWLGIGPTYYFCFLASLVAVCLWLGIRLTTSPSAPSTGGVVEHM